MAGAVRTMGILIGVSEVVAVAPSGSKAPLGWDPQFWAQVLSRDGPEGALGSLRVPCGAAPWLEVSLIQLHESNRGAEGRVKSTRPVVIPHRILIQW